MFLSAFTDMPMRGRKTHTFGQRRISWYIAALWCPIYKKNQNQKALLQPIPGSQTEENSSLHKPWVPGNTDVYNPKTNFFLIFLNIAVLTKIFKTFHFYQSAIHCIHNSIPVSHIGYMACTYPYQFVREIAKEVCIYCACLSFWPQGDCASKKYLCCML